MPNISKDPKAECRKRARGRSRGLGNAIVHPRLLAVIPTSILLGCLLLEAPLSARALLSPSAFGRDTQGVCSFRSTTNTGRILLHSSTALQVQSTRFEYGSSNDTTATTTITSTATATFSVPSPSTKRTDNENIEPTNKEATLEKALVTDLPLEFDLKLNSTRAAQAAQLMTEASLQELEQLVADFTNSYTTAPGPTRDSSLQELSVEAVLVYSKVQTGMTRYQTYYRRLATNDTAWITGVQRTLESTLMELQGLLKYSKLVSSSSSSCDEIPTARERALDLVLHFGRDLSDVLVVMPNNPAMVVAKGATAVGEDVPSIVPTTSNAKTSNTYTTQNTSDQARPLLDSMTKEEVYEWVDDTVMTWPATDSSGEVDNLADTIGIVDATKELAGQDAGKTPSPSMSASPSTTTNICKKKKNRNTTSSNNNSAQAISPIWSKLGIKPRKTRPASNTSRANAASPNERNAQADKISKTPVIRWSSLIHNLYTVPTTVVPTK